MSFWRRLAFVLLLVVLGMFLSANWLAPAGYRKQYREAAGAPPSGQHWLETFSFSRVLLPPKQLVFVHAFDADRKPPRSVRHGAAA